MAKAFSSDIGAFLPTTTIFDEAQVRQLDIQSDEFKEFLVTLLQTLNNIALVKGRPRSLNLKQMLRYFVNHRHDVIVRRTSYELGQAEKKAHIRVQT